MVERVGGLLRCNTPLGVILVNMLATGTTYTYSSVAVQANATIRTSYSLRGLCHSTTELEFSQITQTGSREGFFTGDTEASTMAINHVVDRSCIHRNQPSFLKPLLGLREHFDAETCAASATHDSVGIFMQSADARTGLRRLTPSNCAVAPSKFSCLELDLHHSYSKQTSQYG